MKNCNTLYYNVPWDLKKSKSNLTKHGIRFEEAATVLFAENTIAIESITGYGEQRFITIGFSVKARLLVVVFTDRSEEEIRIISARRATKNEAKKYEERI